MSDKQKFVLILASIMAVALISAALVIAGKSDQVVGLLAAGIPALCFLGFCWMVFR
jgi:hypothetical protein